MHIRAGRPANGSVSKSGIKSKLYKEYMKKITTIFVFLLTSASAIAADANHPDSFDDVNSSNPVLLNNLDPGFKIVGFGGFTDIETNTWDAGEEDHYIQFGGSLHGLFSLNEHLNIQVNLGGEHTDIEETPDQDYYGFSAYGSVHLFSREIEQFMFGVLGGLTYVKVGEQDTEPREKAYIPYGGFDIAYYNDDWTLYGQAGYAHTIGYERVRSGKVDNDFPGYSVFGRLGSRYFLTEDTKLAGELSFFSGEHDFVSGVVRFYLVGLALEAEQLIMDGPGQQMQWSAFGRFETLHAVQSNNDNESTDYTFKVGLKGYFGRNTLRDNDRYGPNLETPDIGRWAGVLNGPLE